MNTQQVTIERVTVVSTKRFDDVLAGLEKEISRPDMRSLSKKMDEASSFQEYQRVVNEAPGPAGLMEFLRLDLGGVLRKDPAAKAYKMVRIIAGNPLIMKQMAEHTPDVGSYAPVTILVSERADGVHLTYDTMASYLASYGSEKASEVARALDAKVIGALSSAAA